jgi:putative PIN family toxin of toxin-antitoxin system
VPGRLIRVVLDPNVLISAAISESGAPAEILRSWERGEFELIVSAEVVFELSEVLRRPKLRRYLNEEQILEFVLWIHDGAAEVSEELPENVVRGVTSDPDDDYLVGVAFQGEADVIISGDRHLLDLEVIRDGVGDVIARIMSPRDFLKELG